MTQGKELIRWCRCGHPLHLHSYAEARDRPCGGIRPGVGLCECRRFKDDGQPIMMRARR